MHIKTAVVISFVFLSIIFLEAFITDFIDEVKLPEIEPKVVTTTPLPPEIDYNTVRTIVQEEVAKVQLAILETEHEIFLPGPVREIFVEKEVPTDNVFAGCLTADILWQNPQDDSLWLSAVGTICDGYFTQIVPETLDTILAGREALRRSNITLRYELCTNTTHKDWFSTSPQCVQAHADYISLYP
jgi:hypothetical protein